MKKIIYAGTEVLTGDEIARALLRFGEVLAQVGSAETVEVPVRETDGSVGVASLLVGPSSQMVARDADDSLEELVDEATVSEMRERTRRLRPHADGAEEAPPRIDWQDDL